MPSPDRGWLTLLALLCAGCGPDRVHATWPDGLDLAYLVIVPKDWGGVVEELDISGPFSLVSPPTTRLETPAGTRLFVVGLEEDLLLGVHPRLTRGKPWSLGPQSSGLTAEPSCGPDGWVHEGDELELPLTPARPGIELFELAFGDGSFERAEDAPFTHMLSLRTPLDPCMGGRRLVVEPFAESRVPDVEDQAIYGDLQYLDDDTVLVTTGGTLRVVRRGAPDSAERVLRVDQLGLPPAPEGTGWFITSVALHGSADDGLGLAAITLSGVDALTQGGAIVRFRLTPGAIEPGPQVWLSTVPIESVDFRISKVVFDARGRWMAVGPGLILSATTATSRARIAEQPPAFDGQLLAATGLEERPYVLAGRRILLWGSPFDGELPLEPFLIVDSVSLNRRFSAMDVATDSDDFALSVLWSSAELSHVRPNATAIDAFPLRISEAETSCTGVHRCGRPSAIQSGALLVAVPDGHDTVFLVAPEGCAALYLVDPRGDCALRAGIELSSNVLGGQSDRGLLHRGTRRGDRVVVAGERGRLLEARLEP